MQGGMARGALEEENDDVHQQTEQEFLALHGFARCRELEGCLGFTFEGEPRAGPINIYFKDKWDVEGEGWTSYQPLDLQAPQVEVEVEVEECHQEEQIDEMP